MAVVAAVINMAVVQRGQALMLRTAWGCLEIVWRWSQCEAGHAPQH